jgi:aryl-alcohol dehydrogenase-like predicted oxidoreductase
VISASDCAARLVLGTAQFGLDYGIGNQSGQTPQAEAVAILETGYAHGLRVLDTAAAYGDCEQRLGSIGLERWGVISKLPPMPDDVGNINRWVRASAEASLLRLRIPRLHGLLLHRPEQLLGPRGAALFAALLELKEHNLTQRIGISIYAPEELDQLCARYEFDIVQCPFNLMDRRLIDSGWLYRLRDFGTELHVRSIFLQGLLLLSPSARPAKFSQWEGLWSDWEHWLQQNAMTPLQACLNYALSFPEIKSIVLGVDKASQLQEITGIIGLAMPPVPGYLQSNDIRLINPARWNELQ